MVDTITCAYDADGEFVLNLPMITQKTLVVAQFAANEGASHCCGEERARYHWQYRKAFFGWSLAVDAHGSCVTRDQVRQANSCDETKQRGGTKRHRGCRRKNQRPHRRTIVCSPLRCYAHERFSAERARLRTALLLRARLRTGLLLRARALARALARAF